MINTSSIPRDGVKANLCGLYKKPCAFCARAALVPCKASPAKLVPTEMAERHHGESRSARPPTGSTIANWASSTSGAGVCGTARGRGSASPCSSDTDSQLVTFPRKEIAWRAQFFRSASCRLAVESVHSECCKVLGTGLDSLRVVGVSR